MLAALVFVFVCDTACTEQGRFIRNIQDYNAGGNVALSAVSPAKTNYDALAEIHGIWTHLSVFRGLGRQSKNPVRSYELVLILVEICLIYAAFRRSFRFYSPDIVPAETSILGYIMNKDGKK